MAAVPVSPTPATMEMASVPLEQAFAHRTAAYGVLFMRLAIGVWFLYHEAWEKMHTWTDKTLPNIFGTWIKNPEGYKFYQSFLQDVALPNAEFFRFLVTYWELALAFCLILGLGLRVVIPLQVFANLNFILGKTYMSGGSNLDRLTIICLVGLWLVSAGRVYGLDAWLRQRFPKLRWL